MPTFTGDENNNVINGGSGDDVIFGLGGSDTLDGGAGNDTMNGGLGDDYYFVDSASDRVLESALAGFDTVFTTVSFGLEVGSEIDALRVLFASGTTAINLAGNEFGQVLAGNAGANYLSGGGGDDYLEGLGGSDTLDGGTGTDVLRGGVGDDYYFVDSVSDRVLEAAGEGRDTIFTTVSFALQAGQHVEELRLSESSSTTSLNLTGNEQNQVLAGNAGANALNGGAGDDYLEGRGGSDTLDGQGGNDVAIGGTGDDYYFVDSAADRVLELVGEGFDTVFTTVAFTLESGSEVDALRVLNVSSTAALNLIGNEFGQVLAGNAGANVLNGGGGADYLEGLGGNDTLDGGTGADVLRGGVGDDYYFVENASDRVLETAGQGSDTVFTSVSFALETGADLEALRILDAAGGAALALTGNEIGQILAGNAGANVIHGLGGDDYLEGRGGNDMLDGGLGNDVLLGGAGDDYYFVDSSADRVLESVGEGRDVAFTTVSLALEAGSEVEELRLLDAGATTSLNLSGNERNQVLAGNAGANILNGGAGDDYVDARAGNDTLDGGAGADAMVGGAGNDTYRVDSTSDRVIEAAGAGADSVTTSVGFTLEAGSEVEFLSATDPAAMTPINLIGNEFSQTLTGNAGSNVLSGGGGNDTLRGGGGTDNLYGGTGMDTLTGDSGADWFHFNTALGAGNVDTLTDFNLLEDKFVLDGQVGGAFQGLATGALHSEWFTGGGQATLFSHRIVYNSATGALSYDSDGAGGQGAVQFAALTPGTALDWSAFVVNGPANNVPTITSGGTASVTENSDVGTIVYQIAAQDPEGDFIFLGITGTDAAFFNVDSVGAVRLNSPANFEARQAYSFDVWAYDSSGTGVVKAVTLSVTDVVETVPAYKISEGSGANDSLSQSVPLNRSLFSITPNSALPDDELPSAQISGSISTLTDRDFFSVTLTAGELLILDVDGTVTLDAFLRVFGPGGTELTSNDDAVTFDSGSNPHTGVSHNMDSLVKFRAPTDGTYYFAIESFSDETGPTSTGGYTLNVSIGPQATAAQLIEENIQALGSGTYWSNLNVTYGFPSFAGQYGSGEATDELATFQPLLPAQQTAARQMLSYAATLTNLSFTEATSSPGGAMMRFGRTQDGETAHAYYPGSGDGGDSWYNSASGDYDNPVRGNYAWATFLHEIGHALGLKHGHESPALTPDRNSLEYSVMTYSPYVGASTGPDGGYTNELFGFPQTYMMFDIAALQRAYGADFTTNSGDSVYSWSSSTGAFMINSVTQWTPGANRVFQTIWDGGGTDTYDLSNYSAGSGTTIDLRPGQFSLFSTVQRAYLGEGHYAAGNVANALLYNGDTRSLIENVIGTQGSDTIIGNDAANRLTGGAGADVFSFLSLSQSTASAPDSIADFQSTDRLNLAGVDANSGSSGDDAFTFIGSAAFGGQAGQLRSQTVGSDLHILGDTNGDAVADLQIILLGVSNLSTSQFSAL